MAKLKREPHDRTTYQLDSAQAKLGSAKIAHEMHEATEALSFEYDDNFRLKVVIPQAVPHCHQRPRQFQEALIAALNEIADVILIKARQKAALNVRQAEAYLIMQLQNALPETHVLVRADTVDDCPCQPDLEDDLE